MAVQMWRAIQARAEQAAMAQGGATRLAEKIAKKFGEIPFELHVGSHGAGDFLLTELVHLLPAISTGELIAPATTMQTFENTYKPMLARGQIEQLTITTLTDQSETSDRIGADNESVLCLASNVLAVDDVDSDSRFHWGPQSAGDAIAADEIDEWAAQTLDIEPVPILGMQRFLDADPNIDALKNEGQLAVEVVSDLSHEDVATANAVWAAVIARLERTREAHRRPDSTSRSAFAAPWVREDPLAREQRELRDRR